MKIIKLLMLVFVFSCADKTNINQKAIEMNSAFGIISDRNSSNISLLTALNEISKEKESSQFWVNIANDSTYSDDHRRRAIFMLFKRHVSSNINLMNLGSC